MNKIAFVKRFVVAGGFLFLCAAPKLAFGQSSPLGSAPPAPMRSASAPPHNPTPPPDLLAGLTLTDDQKAKINQIREDTRSRLDAVANDSKLGPEAKDAMLGGYQRIENGKIFEVLTLDQQREVRRRMSAWRDAAGQHPHQFKERPVPLRNSQAK
jgi:hypothetical protein